MGAKEHDRPHGLLATVLVVVAWYAANIMLLLLNKFLLSSTKFRQPVFLTLCHMTACVVMGLMISTSGWMPLKPLKSRAQFVKICFLSLIFCGTIVLGNASLKYLPGETAWALPIHTSHAWILFFLCSHFHYTPLFPPQCPSTRPLGQRLPSSQPSSPSSAKEQERTISPT